MTKIYGKLCLGGSEDSVVRGDAPSVSIFLA